jgi:type II secretory pathway predicted ATPase ExeA
VSNPAFGTRGLYVSIVSALGGTPRFRKPELIAQAASLLAAEEAERRRRVIFVVDEAHLLSPDQLEGRGRTQHEVAGAGPGAVDGFEGWPPEGTFRWYE